MRDFIRKFWVEIFFGILLILGISFLIGDISIWGFVSELYLELLFSLSTFFTNLIEGVVNFFSAFDISDIIGFMMVVGAGVILMVRARRRFVHSNRYIGKLCPRCGSAILRTHRRGFDHFIGRLFFLNFHRYRCGNQACDWSGLRKPGRTRSYT